MLFFLMIVLTPSPKNLSILSEGRGSEATKAESKDPENVSLAMLIQGVLTKIFILVSEQRVNIPLRPTR